MVAWVNPGVLHLENGLWAVAEYSPSFRVSIFDNKDQLIKKFGSYGSSNGQFNFPRGVAFDSYNHLYVADTGNHRVQQFDINGNYLLRFGSKEIVLDS